MIVEKLDVDDFLELLSMFDGNISNVEYQMSLERIWGKKVRFTPPGWGEYEDERY